MTFGETARRNAVIIRAMLADGEFMAGGVFGRERYYMEKYGLTYEQMYDMQANVYAALTVGYSRTEA